MAIQSNGGRSDGGRNVSPQLERLKAAFDRVKDRPEFLRDERAAWLELRQAVERYLETV